MDDPAKSLFDSLTSFASIQELIDGGEAEGQYLECKAPSSPQFNRDMRAKLARSASGFGNSGGGVIVWGVSTVKHEASDLDVLTQIEPIGNVKRLAQQIDRALPGLTVPRLAVAPSRMMHRVKGDTKGIVITYIPPTPGDPVQSTVDRNFYFRSGDGFHEMPYEMLQRMFAGAAGPLLTPVFNAKLVQRDETGAWKIPILISNHSSAAARDTNVSVGIENPGACLRVTSEGLHDESSLNPGQTIFMNELRSPIFRGLNHLAGTLVVEMKRGSRPKRILLLRVRVFADRMRATEWRFKVQLAQKGFSIKDIEEQFLY